MKKSANLLLVLAILFFYSAFFIRTPFESFLFKLRFLFEIILSFSAIYFLFYKEKNCKNRLLVFFAVLMFLPAFYSAWRANSFFGQPLLFGLLVERRWMTIGFSFLLYFLLVKKTLDFQTVEKAFIIMAFLSLFLFMSVYISAELFPDLTILFKNAVKYTRFKGLRVKLNYYFLVFGAIYFFVRFILKKTKKDFIVFMVFLAVLVLFFKGRIVFILLLLTVYIFLFVYERRKAVPKAIGLFFVLLVFFGFVFLIDSNFAKEVVSPYKAVVETVQGKSTRDFSIVSRKQEANKIISFLMKNPQCYFLGAGRLSKQWKDGYKRIFGRLFPLDVGVLGVVFVYGLLGLIVVFVIPLFIVAMVILKIKDFEEKDVFLLSLKYLLVFVLLQSLFSSKMVFYPYTFALPLFVILAYFRVRGVSVEDIEKSLRFRSKA